MTKFQREETGDKKAEVEVFDTIGEDFTMKVIIFALTKA